MWINFKDKRQLLDIELYLNLKLWDYKHFKYKVIIITLRYAISSFYSY